MKDNNSESYWNQRAFKFNELQWVKSTYYFDELIKSSEFKKNDLILSIGSGTGVFAKYIHSKIKTIIGIDKSKEMIEQSEYLPNMVFIQRDILNPLFYDNIFDKIIARHVFHHILYNTQKAMDECYRILKKGGMMILSEGIPPSPSLEDDYRRIFKLKEKRLVFLQEDLENLLKKSGFKNVKTKIILLKNMSIRNWLEKSMLSYKIQDKILKMHLEGSKEFKKAYNLIEKNNDCYVDFKIAITTGIK